MTKLIALLYHRELWTWLSKNPDKEKRDWPGWDVKNPYFTRLIGECNSYCFACMVSNDICGECLINWGNDEYDYTLHCTNCLSVYSRWSNSCTSKRSTAKNALIISKLPMRGATGELKMKPLNRFSKTT